MSDPCKASTTVVRCKRLQARDSEARRTDTEVMTIKGVARFLFMSEQAVRSIGRDLLPRYKVGGRWDLFLKDDVLHYVRQCRRRGLQADVLVRDIAEQVLGSESDSGRRRPDRRTYAKRS